MAATTRVPTVKMFMTKTPHTIGSEMTLEKAQKLMGEYRVRHLPVLKGGELIGILSDRDIQMVETFRDVNPAKVKVEEAFTADPYMVSPTARLDKVCGEMADHKYSCVLVVDRKKLVGIFTWIDALNATREILSKH